MGMFSSELGYNKYMAMTKQGWIKRKANGIRFAIDNGRTLCIDCHKKTDTYGGRTIYKKVCLAAA